MTDPDNEKEAKSRREAALKKMRTPVPKPHMHMTNGKPTRAQQSKGNRVGPAVQKKQNHKGR